MDERRNLELVRTKVPHRGRREDMDSALPPPPSSMWGSNAAQKIIAAGVVLLLLYFGKVVSVTVITALLLALLIEPMVSGFERMRLPRPLGAALALLILGAITYTGSYFFFLRAQQFADELPKYSRQLRESVVKFRRHADKLQETKQAIMPQSAEEKRAVTVKQLDSISSEDQASLTETVLAVSFVPFLAYFMLTWYAHARATLIGLFSDPQRTTAYVALSQITRMLRGFLAGNLIVGLIMGAISAAVFWWVGVPYAVFIGLISGMLSLVPYLGLVLACLPPLAAGIGVLKASEFPVVIVAAVAIHLIGINVLYPKILGKRMQLNPLVVTIALLFWGFLWGAAGLLLALPITAAIKIICDHVESLNPLGALLGDSEQAA